VRKILALSIFWGLLFAIFGQSISNVHLVPSKSSYIAGNKVTIYWNYTGMSIPSTAKVKITLWRQGATQNTCKIAENVPITKGTNGHPWTIHSSCINPHTNASEDLTSGSLRIRVRWQGHAPAVYGESSFFEIQKILLKPGVFKAMAPRIDGVLDVPIGALRPGTKVYLKGSKFGKKKGQILIYGNFKGINSPVALVNVNWKNSKQIDGVVPQILNGQPNQTVQLKVKTSYNMLSNPWNVNFEGREEKVLPGSAVIANCSMDANINICNWFSDETGDFQRDVCLDDMAICAFHKNSWGTIGDDKGNDKFTINLKNGWVFKKMEILVWKKTSGDEVLSGPTPPFPVGQSSWTATIHWVASPNDYVWYKIKIIVEGPIGTSYK